MVSEGSIIYSSIYIYTNNKEKEAMIFERRAQEGLEGGEAREN